MRYATTATLSVPAVHVRLAQEGFSGVSRAVGRLGRWTSSSSVVAVTVAPAPSCPMLSTARTVHVYVVWGARPELFQARAEVLPRNVPSRHTRYPLMPRLS